MSLQKPIELTTGVVAQYWRVSAILRGIQGDTITVEGYLTQATRAAKKASLSRKSFLAPNITTVADAYALLKTQPVFHGAVDV